MITALHTLETAYFAVYYYLNIKWTKTPRILLEIKVELDMIIPGLF
jgi:hypothetical protein